jgi:hypothetical protein
MTSPAGATVSEIGSTPSVQGGQVHYIQSAREAELNAVSKLQWLGHTDARAVPLGPDGGVDVVSKDALAQVKWKSSVAGRPDIQRLYGARGGAHHKQLYFFASSGYSQHAIEYANDTAICLFTYDPLGEVAPVNAVARDAVREAERAHMDPSTLAALAAKQHRKGKWDTLLGGAFFLFLLYCAMWSLWGGNWGGVDFLRYALMGLIVVVACFVIVVLVMEVRGKAPKVPTAPGPTI